MNQETRICPYCKVKPIPKTFTQKRVTCGDQKCKKLRTKEYINYRYRNDTEFRETILKQTKAYQKAHKDDPVYRKKRSQISTAYYYKHKDDPVFKQKRKEYDKKTKENKKKREEVKDEQTNNKKRNRNGTGADTNIISDA